MNSIVWPEPNTNRRTAYVVDVLWRDVRRNRQREALKLSAAAWKPTDHPEFNPGRRRLRRKNPLRTR